MDISISTTFLWTISCCLWTTEGRKYVHEITVTNGGSWGSWGKPKFCPKGHAVAFSLKVMKIHKRYDNSGLNGIRLHCSDGALIQSLQGRFGTWRAGQFCPSGHLVSFSLRVQSHQGSLFDDTAANNIQFSCSDGSKLMGSGTRWGEFGKWSPPCRKGSFICGIQTKVDQAWVDNTALNDVKFFCC